MRRSYEASFSLSAFLEDIMQNLPLNVGAARVHVILGGSVMSPTIQRDRTDINVIIRITSSQC